MRKWPRQVMDAALQNSHSISFLGISQVSQENVVMSWFLEKLIAPEMGLPT